jgi:UDP-N-acetylmuramyl tripeptide synthase
MWLNRIREVTNIALAVIIAAGIFISLTNNIAILTVTETTTQTVTITSTIYDCTPYSRATKVLSLILYGIDELIYFGNPTLLTTAQNLITQYIQEAQQSKTQPQEEYVKALTAMQSLIDEFLTGRRDDAYRHYAIAQSEIAALGISTRCI